MNSALNSLILTETQAVRAAETTYTTAVQSETPPAATDPGQRWRFARVQAHSGDLLVSVRKANGSQSTPSTGSYRVFAGSAEWFQLAYGAVLDISSVAASATGAVIWGR